MFRVERRLGAALLSSVSPLAGAARELGVHAGAHSFFTSWSFAAPDTAPVQHERGRISTATRNERARTDPSASTIRQVRAIPGRNPPANQRSLDDRPTTT
jgi:hypothetical protein